ncbi:PhzF family phenazine biosynthesis protein [Martelella radicis]|uniref:Trans-2,3-dihydro-3-hydroxyanthranilate isomerase n=1 Tax=Martelella radicis TaxID=1397476 RepID=A0A7W6KGB6_9HYPH|nr:PhzF family phenazine biosynthesis protein [Martelella radicis]MBB4120598.1 trans-2,3-dihydro-3-hydroxyanthranilate isomerase [Martelella radicis]
MREYAIYDVFTAERYHGNPLAVVFNADGLDDEAMQTIACEFNLSETIFLFAPQHVSQSASARIFTPGGELPFAGHPTVGAAIALAERQHGSDTEIDMVSVLGEKIGPVRCAVKLRQDAAGFAEFDLPKLSRRCDEVIAREKLAEALGIAVDEIGFENHVPTIWSAGVPFALVPLRNLGVAEKIEFDPRRWLSFAPLIDGLPVWAYVYTRGGVRHDAHFHSRMFAAEVIVEDPATGSAAAAFSGAIQYFDAPGEGSHTFVIEQGVEMGRPSYLRLNLETGASGEISAARIGGQAVCVARGTLL